MHFSSKLVPYTLRRGVNVLETHQTTKNYQGQLAFSPIMRVCYVIASS